MKLKIVALIFFTLTIFSCKEDLLEVPPIDTPEDDTFWTTEANIRTFSYGFYPNYFVGYASGFTFGPYFTGQSLNDDFAPTTPAAFTRAVPASGGGWTFSFVRKANIFINRVENSPLNDEAKKHWIGVGRFFRALEYSELVNRFGDIPYFEAELEANDIAQLYRPRDPRTTVMDKVLEDFQYAVSNVRLNDGNKGLTVNKDVVLAFMSRAMLFEGTWQKYHSNNTVKASAYLTAAQEAANTLITSGRYNVNTNYRGVFSSVNLTGNSEVILYRQYEPGILTHSLNSYNNKEPQTGASKDAIESYLAKDGLPISISPLYKGDKTLTAVMTDRDPRITETFVNALRLNGVVSNFSTTGYATHKFLNESIKDLTEGSSNLNPTDAPIIRYGEVLVNFAEATAELGTIGGPALTQADLDKSINRLRARPGIALPALQVQGNQPAVNNKVYDDPKRDPTVPALIWEIRRERRIELMMEGFRLDDLRRWKKLGYTDTQARPDINRGAWIKKSEHPKLNTSVRIENGAAEGYIIPASSAAAQRTFTDPKVYLNPLPLDQIRLYKDQGVELAQNPGW